MGRLQAEAMMEASITLEQQISWHLTANHYPPVPTSMVSVCIEAIECVNDSGDWTSELALPEGITFRGSATAPVYDIIEAHHLENWIIESELD